MMIFTAGMMFGASAWNLVLLYLSMDNRDLGLRLTAFSPDPALDRAGLKYASSGRSRPACSSASRSSTASQAPSTTGLRRTVHLLITDAPHAVLFIAILFIMGGFAYKIAAVPFHAWC